MSRTNYGILDPDMRDCPVCHTELEPAGTKPGWDRVLYQRDTGTAPFRKLGYCARCHGVTIEYVKSKMVFSISPARILPYQGTAFQGYELSTKEELLEEERNKQMQTLYEVKVQVAGVDAAKTYYCHKLAVNSAGKWVMEEKTSGDILTVDKSACTEVMPYTVAVVFPTADKRYHFFAKEGDVEVNNVLLLDDYDDFARVVEVNTKSKTASKWLNGLVLHGTRVEGEE